MSTCLLERSLISLLFGLAGLAKLLSFQYEVEAFTGWGFSLGFMYFIGVLEVAAALGIWLQRLSGFVALCLSALAFGALLTRVVFAEWFMAVLTVVVLLLTIHYVWLNRGELFPSDHEYEPPGTGPGKRPLP